MSATQSLSVGDVLIYGTTHRWVVRAIHLGADGQESLIEMESLTHKPGWTGVWEYHHTLWVPEVLVRHLGRVAA